MSVVLRLLSTMDRWLGKVAIVTGASAGIGTAIVESLVENGVNVVALARRKERLDDLAKKLQGKRGKLFPLCIDVTKEEEVLRAFKWTKENVGPVHILINNAGVSRTTSLIDGDTNLWQDVLNTNVLGLCIATREAVRDMRQNSVDGHIIHINSVSGHTVVGGVPNLNVYPASKYAVTALTETLRLDLNRIGSKIKITSISPGLVRTEISYANALASGFQELPKERQYMINSMPHLKAEDIADAILYVLGTPPHVQVHELLIKPVGELF